MAQRWTDRLALEQVRLQPLLTLNAKRPVTSGERYTAGSLLYSVPRSTDIDAAVASGSSSVLWYHRSSRRRRTACGTLKILLNNAELRLRVRRLRIQQVASEAGRSRCGRNNDGRSTAEQFCNSANFMCGQFACHCRMNDNDTEWSRSVARKQFIDGLKTQE